MPDERKFKIGDVVRVTKEGRSYGAPGYSYDKLTVRSIGGPERFMGGGPPEYTIRTMTDDGKIFGAWREKWYELVDPEGPW